VVGAGYRCRDYVRITDELWDFNAIFLVQSRTINITVDEITTNLICVSANTYTAENAESVHNKSEIEIGMTAPTEDEMKSLYDDLEWGASGWVREYWDAERFRGGGTIFEEREKKWAEREAAKRAQQQKSKRRTMKDERRQVAEDALRGTGILPNAVDIKPQGSW
jgi:hypothetical protein